MGTSSVSLVRQEKLGHNFLVARPRTVRYKQPRISIHGMAGFAGYLGDDMLHAAELGYVCYAPDIAGHGERHQEDISRHSVLDYVDDVFDFIEKVVRPKHGTHPLVLVGHSMGGLIAAKLAERRHDVGHVVLVTPAPPRGVMFLPGGLIKVSVSDIIAMLDMALGGERFVPSRRLLESLFADPAASMSVIDMWEKRRMSNESLIAALQLGTSQVAVDPKAINAPMLVVGAKKDVVIHPSVAGRVAKHFAADLHTHETLGHMCPFEAGWEENSRVIHEWLLKQKVR